MRAFSYRSHFRSRDKDGGRIIRYAVTENPMRHANFMDMFYGTGIIADGSFTLNHFCPCDLDLDPMTFIYKLDSYPLDIPVYQMCEN